MIIFQNIKQKLNLKRIFEVYFRNVLFVTNYNLSFYLFYQHQIFSITFMLIHTSIIARQGDVFVKFFESIIYVFH